MTSAGRPTVVAFDVDGTLTTSDSVIPFLRRMVRPAAVLRGARELPVAIGAVARRDRDKLRAAATRAVLSGADHAAVVAAGERFAAEIVAERMRSDTTARLRWHVEQGHRVVLVSASYDSYLHGVAEALGAEAVLSTRVAVADGRCTGALDGSNCRGAEKVVRLHAWLGDQGLRRSDVVVWAYGDSAGDRELLADADYAVWVTEPLDSVAPAPAPPDECLARMPAPPSDINPDQAWHAVADVAGWMTRGQSDTLYAAAAGAPEHGQIVEIGSFQGRSTIVLALAAPVSTRIVAIDPHAGNDRGPQEIDGYVSEAEADHRRFVDNLTAAGVAERVTHLRTFSDQALDDVEGAIDVLYIDGAHRYAPARADIAAWGARVNDSGRMLIHDSFSSIGVTAAILRELVFGRRFRYVGRSRSLASYEATPGGLRGIARAANAARQLAQLGWFARNVALKVGLSVGLGKLFARRGKEPPEWPY